MAHQIMLDDVDYAKLVKAAQKHGIPLKGSAQRNPGHLTWCSKIAGRASGQIAMLFDIANFL